MKRLMVLITLQMLLCIFLSSCGLQKLIDITDESTSVDKTEEIVQTEEYLKDDEEIVIRAAEDVSEELKEYGTECGYENALSELAEKNVQTIDADTYYRFQQIYKGIPVYGRTVVYAADAEGNVMSITGNVMDIPVDINLTPTVTNEAVEQSVKAFFVDVLGYDKEQWKIYNDLSSNDLVIYNLDEPNTTIAYCLNIGGYEFIVDAHSAEIIFWSQTLFSNTNSISSATTNSESYGMQVRGGDYILYDARRNIYIYDAGGNDYWDPNTGAVNPNVLTLVRSENREFGDEDDNTGTSDVAVSFLRTLGGVYDFYSGDLREIGHGVMAGIYNSSFPTYNGENAGGGIAAVAEYLPLTPPEYDSERYSREIGILIAGSAYNDDFNEVIDVLGHEYTHQVTKKYVSWTYGWNEINGTVSYNGNLQAGAIDEGLSDIFGELIQKKVTGNVDWVHDDKRYIYDPSINGYPEFSDEIALNSNGWLPVGAKTTDYAHGYSTVISHAAYLMWNGIDGNANKKIDTDTLAKIWYRAMLMMPNDCDFLQCRELVLLAADSMKVKDAQRKCIMEAFDRVGITTDVLVNYKISPAAELKVFDADGNLYGNYTYHISGTLSNRASEIGKTYEETVTVDIADLQVLDLREGFYTIRIMDNSGAQQPYTFTVHVAPYETDAENEILIYTNYSYDSQKTQEKLSYEMRTAEYVLGKTTGNIVYPYFIGDSPAEQKINDRYETFLSIVNSGEEISDLDTRCPLQWGSSLLRYTKISAEVVYNRNGAISVKETCVVDYGGMHPYHVVSGLIYENVSGRSLGYTDILRGSFVEMDETLYKALQAECPWANEHMLETMKNYTGYALTEEGLCFYYNVGDAVERAKLIVPYTSQDSYIIILGEEKTTTSELEYEVPLDGCYRYYDAGFYVEYIFKNDGTFSFDMVLIEEIEGFDRDYGSGKYTVAGDVLTLTFYDGDHPGDSVVYTFERSGEDLKLYFEDQVFEYVKYGS